MAFDIYVIGKAESARFTGIFMYHVNVMLVKSSPTYVYVENRIHGRFEESFFLLPLRTLP